MPASPLEKSETAELPYRQREFLLTRRAFLATSLRGSTLAAYEILKDSSLKDPIKNEELVAQEKQYRAKAPEKNEVSAIDFFNVDKIIKGNTPSIPIDPDTPEGALPVTFHKATGPGGDYHQAVPTGFQSRKDSSGFQDYRSMAFV